jgi:hypothetical protein
VAVAVICGAFLVVAEHVVGFADFLEFVLGALVARIFVRVIFDRELAVGLFKSSAETARETPSTS